MLVESRDGLEPFDGRRRKTVAVAEDLVEVRNGDFQGVGVRGARTSNHREPEDSPVHSGPLPRKRPSLAARKSTRPNDAGSGREETLVRRRPLVTHADTRRGGYSSWPPVRAITWQWTR